MGSRLTLAQGAHAFLIPGPVAYNVHMRQSVTIKGRVSDSRRVELAEPVDGVGEEVEVVIRSIAPQPGKGVFDFIASLPSGTRTNADIDRQIREERDSRGDR